MTRIESGCVIVRRSNVFELLVCILSLVWMPAAALQDEVSVNITEVATMGMMDVCRWTVREDTLSISAILLYSEGSDFEQWLGIENRMLYDMKIPVVVRSGVDLSTDKPRVFLQGDTLTFSIPKPTVFGSCIDVGGMSIVSASDGSFLSSPYALHDAVLRNLDNVVQTRLRDEIEAILLECQVETEEHLEGFLGTLYGVHHTVIEWR